MHTLLLEKDIVFLKIVESFFSAENLTFSSYSDPIIFLDEFSNQNINDPDLVIISQNFLMSQKKNLCVQIKTKWPSTKIIGLADLPGAKHRIALLEKGMDDCLTKPIDFSELLLRLRIVSLRKVNSTEYSEDSTGNLILDENIKDCIVLNQRLKLNHHEYLLAEIFVKHPKKVFSRFTLMDLVWNTNMELESNSVESTISSLRKKMKLAGATHEIKSRRKIGYWLDIKSI
ncbi:MAG: response regulator transcription factor [Bdellovibrionales bacterium]|nr:response regulator transcription factor [Bdellovibrionales bacterium]